MTRRFADCRGCRIHWWTAKKYRDEPLIHCGVCRAPLTTARNSQGWADIRELHPDPPTTASPERPNG